MIRQFEDIEPEMMEENEMPLTPALMKWITGRVAGKGWCPHFYGALQQSSPACSVLNLNPDK